MATHFGLSQRGFASTILLGLAAWAPAISAATFTVGPLAQGCTQSTVEEAVAATEGNPGPDIIRVTRSTTYTQQAISFSVTQEVTITGGFADCTTNVEDADFTTLDGSGGAQATVMTITADIGSIIHLRKLLITGGDVTSSSIAGGGIYYTGKGLLDIANSSISNNTGAFGGGINVGGTDDAAELDIGPNTTLYGNTAHYNGGGLFSNNIKTAIHGDDIVIDFNTATGITSGASNSGGYGGGIHIRACDRNSTVYIGSPGAGIGLGVVYSNSARYGGGVSIEGAQGCSSEGDAELRMYSIDPTRRTTIQANQASIAGGGVYTAPNNDWHNHADAYFWNVSIIGNTAPNASALFLGADGDFQGFGFQSIAIFNSDGAPAGAIACDAGRDCGEIRGNISSSGQVIDGEQFDSLSLARISVTANQGTELIRLHDVSIGSSLIAGNTSSARLIEAHRLIVGGSTIAGNTVGGPHVLGIDTDGYASIDGTIIWQPGKPALHNDGDLPHVLDVLGNEISTLTGSGSARLITAEPRFVDPAHGDYSLTAASPAVDFAPASIWHGRDLFGHDRDIDLVFVPDAYGPEDLGAFERQTLHPLVLNSTFDANVNLWPEVALGASNWDGTQNIAGPTGSGALHVSVTGSSVTARKQCVHLPGPSIYTINGWGKSTGTITPGSYVRLAWEYRSAGSETCTGTVTSSGSLLLANHGTWHKPSTPAAIEASDFAWTTDSSILVYLIVEDGGGIGAQSKAPTANLNAWFDGIEILNDRIFANGFQ